MSIKFCITLLLIQVALCHPCLGQVASVEPSAANIEELVGQLGNDSFEVREKANAELSKLGLAAKRQLLAGIKSEDAEIASRCRALWDAVKGNDFEARAEAFLNDPLPEDSHEFPAWDRYRAGMGASRKAKSLFVQMQKSEPQFWVDLNRNADDLPQDIGRLIEKLVDLNGNLQRRREVEWGSIATLLFVTDLTRSAVPFESIRKLDTLTNESSLFEAMREHEPLRELWFRHKQAVQGNRADTGWLVTCLMYNEKLAVEVARAMLLDPGTKPADKQLPLLTLAKANRPEDEGLIVLAMNDSTVVDTRILGGRTIKTQLRDVAFACMILRAGGKPADLGFKFARVGDLTILSPSTLGFQDDSERFAAFAAWSESKR